MTSDQLTTLAAVLADPADDLARLQFADACDEAGEVERAEFVRVQVELARNPCPDRRRNDLRYMIPEPWNALRRRERELFISHGAGWFGSTGCITPPNERERLAGGEFRIVRRGFVSSIRLPLAAFLEHAEAIFRAQPVTDVTLTDCEPHDERDVMGEVGGFRWSGEPNYIEENAGGGTPTCAEGWLPLELARRMVSHPEWTVIDDWDNEMLHEVHRTYPTRKAAMSALSAACVAWGRQRAGLPPLPCEVIKPEGARA